MEIPITFNADRIVLEGRLERMAGQKVAILAHPHPLYGGDMDNAVVNLMAKAYAGQGWSTLRFNFRGTGRSTGQFEDGVGEQRDVQAAIAFLMAKGFRRIDLAGYSFGAWVLAQWACCRPKHKQRLILVAPPVAFMDFTQIIAIAGLHQVITGSLDDLAPPRQIASLMARWHPQARQTVIQGADHSFWDYFHLLEQTLAEGIRRPISLSVDY